jgi:hypothetical protein
VSAWPAEDGQLDRCAPTAALRRGYADAGARTRARRDGDRVIYRVLFAEEGSRGQVLLSLEAFKKKTQKTPPAAIALRSAVWRTGVVAGKRCAQLKAIPEAVDDDRGTLSHE